MIEIWFGFIPVIVEPEDGFFLHGDEPNSDTPQDPPSGFMDRIIDKLCQKIEELDAR